MMPGEKQAEPEGVASEASAGTCENCTVLNRSLDEYMTALLTLKQKIIDTDHLLSEYKEKCDELQKSQRESSMLHKQLDEVLLKLGPLEKQTMDLEAVKLELEKTKIALESYQQKSEEVDRLREENAKTLALNKKLEVDLKTADDTAKTQSLAYAKLQSENKTLEETLQKTQDSLRMCQQAAEEAEDLRLQNAKTLILKSNLENQLLVLEDTKLRQANEITDLRREKSRLEENLWKMQEQLTKLEKEVNKEKRTTSTQTKLEPNVDKAKVRMLLEELWHCVEPLSQTTEMLDFNGAADSLHMSTPLQVRLSPRLMPVSPCRKQISTAAKEIKLQGPDISNSMLKVSPGRHKAKSSLQEENSPSKEQRSNETGKKRKRTLGSEELELRSTWIDDDDDDHPPDRGCWRNSTDLVEILECFMPLPAALSPIPYFEQSAEIKGLSVSNVNTSSLSDVKCSEQPTPESTDPAEPNPIEDAVITPSINASPGPILKSDFLNTNVPLVLNSCLSESQDMEVEEGCEVKESTEDLTCAAATQGVESAHERDCVTMNPARIAVQLNTVEDHINIQSQCAGSEIPNALCVEAINKESDPDHTGHKCLDTDITVECSETKSEVTEDTSEIPLNTGTHSETESEITVKEIQSSVASDATIEERHSKTVGNLEGQQHDSSSTKINGVSFVESSKHEELSDEEEFFNLKRKVRGIFSKPGQKSYSEDLDSDTVNMPQSAGKQEVEDQFQKTNSGTEEGGPGEFSKTLPNPENEKDGASLQEAITHHSCKPSMLKDSAVIDGQLETAPTQKHEDESVDFSVNSLQIIDTHNQQDEENLSEALDLTFEKTVFTEQKECNTKAEDSSVNPQDVCAPALVVQMLSDMDRGKNLSPLTAFASRDAIASTPSPESIGRARTEMGPPLPPAVMPLTATPPKFGNHHTPVRPKVPLPAWLPPDVPPSPEQQPAPSSLEGLQDEVKQSPCLTTPSPSCGVPSSPLQFGSATPKHAVPVPGRLPSSALNSSSPSASQENSMQMLDSMYPELSAQARTLNILRGNVNLARTGSENGASPPSVNQISGNKTINSSSTAFTKTEQKAKRTGVNMLLPKSAKKLRLDACSPVPVNTTSSIAINSDRPTGFAESTEPHSSSSNQEQSTESKSETKNDKEFQISDALEKLQMMCFDVLPVIKSHVFLGRISEVPVLRDEEKSVISDFCSSQCSAEEFMLAVLSQMKTKRAVLKQEFLQSICRVYTGLCRQRGDLQTVHAFAYSILKENFPEAPKLILFMVTTWPSVLSCENSLCKAIQTVCKLKAEGEILDYLTAYLHWDKTPPGDIHEMISNSLKALLEGSALKFQKHDRHGDDLCPTAWEYIFSLDLLCAHLGWKWTHDNIIGKELWPVMNAWVSQPRLQQTPVRDVCVAAVLRLIGRLGQLGIKEKLCKSVENVAKAINLFGKHGIQEGVPWEVQLSAIYTIYDLAAINPKDALEAMASWRGETTQPVPSSVTSCITQIGCLCRQIRT